MKKLTKQEIASQIESKLLTLFGEKPARANDDQMFRACAALIGDLMRDRTRKMEEAVSDKSERQVHYLCMEFLIGRSLRNNAYNLGILDELTGALAGMGKNISDLLELESDAALGNGGLGRLASCYFDSLSSLELPATGYSIRYEHGVFRQKIIDGKQVEFPDSWLDYGQEWTIRRADESEEVHFGGAVKEVWEDGKLSIIHSGYQTVVAEPYDFPISGYRTEKATYLRLWSAKAKVELDMDLFSKGEYLKSLEQYAMAEVISKVLYPEDNHIEGRMLRLKQQYFFSSATMQSIIKKHKSNYGTLDNFAEKNIIHINDTHPTMAIPEMMRILMDCEGYSWDDAWAIVSKSFAYTNHTVMQEALEKWPESLIERLLPRIHSIIKEINRRLCEELAKYYPGEPDRISRMAILSSGEVRMANMCVACCTSVNGVSALHSQILKDKVFRDYYNIYPLKFTNVTNGIAYRRWLCQANPELDKFITSLIGEGYKKDADCLSQLSKFAEDASVSEKLAAIKRENKIRLADYVKSANGIILDPDSIFDIQTKRLHEYKRQLLNLMNIIRLYGEIKRNPGMELTPHTYIFGAKASAGYYMAKRIIQLINSVALRVNNDPDVRGRIKVVFIEDYKVSLAEIIIPAAELSEQISIAGKEASGTGNMKFMINGAVTIGTLDGANVEIHEAVGDSNMFLFGLHADEVENIKQRGYKPSEYVAKSAYLNDIIATVKMGFGDGADYSDIINSLLPKDGGFGDPYMICADFDSYAAVADRAVAEYADARHWNKMSLMNIAGAGRFSADRSIREYADNIWKIKKA